MRRLTGTGMREKHIAIIGSNSVQWPGFTFDFRRQVHRFDPGDYLLQPEPSEVPAHAR